MSLPLVPKTVAIALLGLLGAVSGSGAADLFDGFKDGWRQGWREEQLSSRPTIYTVTVGEAGRPVLRANSRSAHAGLLRPLALASPAKATLRWRWKVRGSLTGNDRERTRGGDDYAARIMVIFETSTWPLRTRALNYVWAAHESVGAIFPSPYTRNVGMIVVRSGEAEAGIWQQESRDVLADYRSFFGEPATRISAVAVLVDTDNTGRTAEAWFADLNLESPP